MHARVSTNYRHQASTPVPAIAIHPPDQRHHLIYQTLMHQHGLHNVSAAHLLVYGRRATHAYAHTHGQDLNILVPFLVAAVGAWTDGQAGDRAIVSSAADVLDHHMLSADYGNTPAKKKKKKRHPG